MVTRLQLKYDILSILAKRDEALADLPVPLITTSAGSTTTLLDTKLSRGTTQANRYDARALEIMSALSATTIVSSSVADPSVITATGHGLTITGQIVTIADHADSTPDINGEHVITYIDVDTFSIPVNVTVGGTGGTVTEKTDRAAVDDGGFDGTSTLTFSPAALVLPATATDYLLYPRGLSPSIIHQAIDEVLRNTEIPSFWFPSMTDDADFDANSLWTSVGSPTTKEFVTTSAHVLFGERSHHILSDAADEGIRSAAVAVHEGESLLVSVFVRPKNCKVGLYDITASEDIREITVDETAFTEVRFTDPVPASCESVRVEFRSGNASSEFYVGAPVILQSFAGRPYVAPSWFTHEDQFIEALYLPQGFTSTVNYSYIALSAAAQAAPRPTFLRQDRGVNPVMLELKASNAGPVIIAAYRTLAELSADTSTSPADRQYVRDKAIANILRDRGEAEAGLWARKAARRAQALGYGGRAVRLEENVLVGV